MPDPVKMNHPCDLCGADQPILVPCSPSYMDGQSINVCSECGFVYVNERRSSKAIADSWSDDLYQSDYTARIPLVKARQTYVADTIETEIGLRNKRLCDIGGGEGQFLQIAQSDEYNANVFAIEPSTDNCRLLDSLGIENFNGTIETFSSSRLPSTNKVFDIVTVMWTLENCHDCRALINNAWEMLDVNGHIVVATGSRILVPFKKPLNMYLSDNPSDTHCFRFSANTLQGLLMTCGFEITFVNRYIDTDWLVVIGRKIEKDSSVSWTKDDPQQVLDFFDRWDQETRKHHLGAK